MQTERSPRAQDYIATPNNLPFQKRTRHSRQLSNNHLDAFKIALLKANIYFKAYVN